MRVVHEPAGGDGGDGDSTEGGEPTGEDHGPTGGADGAGASAAGDGDDSPATGDERVLAREVEFADGLFSQGVGLMFRRSIPEDYALVFRFGRTTNRGLHMLCVPFDIDAVWLVDGEVTAVERLRAWWGRGKARADTVIELPAGAADGVGPGDRVRVLDDD